MAGALAYVDSSAFVKLVLGEGEAAALRAELTRWDGHVASRLLRTEAIRACASYGDAFADLAHEAMNAVALIPIDDSILEAAAVLDPPELRTLDALHLATALSLGDDLGAMLVYDVRLASAARQAGVNVVTPGA